MSNTAAASFMPKDACVLCMDSEFDDNRAFMCRKKLPCGHLFHEICLLSITGTDNLCPVCGVPRHVSIPPEPSLHRLRRGIRDFIRGLCCKYS